MKVARGETSHHGKTHRLMGKMQRTNGIHVFFPLPFWLKSNDTGSRDCIPLVDGFVPPVFTPVVDRLVTRTSTLVVDRCHIGVHTCGGQFSFIGVHPCGGQASRSWTSKTCNRFTVHAA